MVARCGRRVPRPSWATEEPRDDVWPGPEPSAGDQDKLQQAMKQHQGTHSVQDAGRSMHTLRAIMQDISDKGKIPNRNAMQIYLQHCCAKSASYEAEEASFEAANFGLDIMERHGCRFDVSTVHRIAMQLSLRAGVTRANAFVGNLVSKALGHLQADVLLYIERTIAFALSERAQTVSESLARAEPFSERGLRIDWERSSAQEFRVHNTDCQTYKPTEGYGFARKGLVALMSIDPEPSSLQRNSYRRQRDGAIVEIVKAPTDDENEPLVLRLRTQVTIPFEKDLLYRLDDLDIAEVQTERMLKCLQILGSDPQCSRLSPAPQLRKMLLLPPEEPYTISVLLQPKSRTFATLEKELNLTDESAEPFRVKAIGEGVFQEWNRTHPHAPVRAGDRILEINGIRGKAEMLEEVRAAQGRTQRLEITLMRKVKMHDRRICGDELLPSAPEAEAAFARKLPSLSERLNSSQLQAVRQASTQQLCLIQGPPGTGKTTTAIELLDFLLANKLVPTPILVSGHTNAAVDNILVGLARKGKRVVRVGEGAKVREDCRPYMPGEERSVDPQQAEVICATCIGSGGSFFDKEGLKFHTVLIDECSQAPEAACIVPICRATEQLILVGDQCQLQPMVKSDLARSQDLGVSLFNRLCRQGVCPVMLDTQYRMHPAIAEFPSGAFYNGLLKSGVHSGERRPTSYWKWPSPMTPVCFIDAWDGWDSSEEGGVGITNEREVSLVLDVLNQILCDPKLSSKGEDGTYPVGIVTPYAAQKDLIINNLKQAGLVDAKGKQLVETNSVDGFQGREKEVIIFSAVRSNLGGGVGFLHDWRRINVMLTRAKRGLIVIGNRETLKTDIYWKSWLKWASTRGCIQGEGAIGSWTPLCMVEDEWVMRPQDSSFDTPTPCARDQVPAPTPDSWGDWQEACQESERPHSEPCASSSAAKCCWEDWVTDSESEPEDDVSTTDAESFVELSRAGSVAEPYVGLSRTGSVAESFVELSRTEGVAESLAELLRTESVAESLAEFLRTDSVAEPSAQLSRTESVAESFVRPSRTASVPAWVGDPGSPTAPTPWADMARLDRSSAPSGGGQPESTDTPLAAATGALTTSSREDLAGLELAAEQPEGVAPRADDCSNQPLSREVSRLRSEAGQQRQRERQRAWRQERGQGKVQPLPKRQPQHGPGKVQQPQQGTWRAARWQDGQARQDPVRHAAPLAQYMVCFVPTPGLGEGLARTWATSAVSRSSWPAAMAVHQGAQQITQSVEQS